MMVQRFLSNQQMRDLSVSYHGYSICPPGQVYGPAMRDHHLYVFVIRGRGTYEAAGQIHHLGAGQAFVMFPNELTSYCSDPIDPWEYIWFGFDGLLAASYMLHSGLSAENPIVTHTRPDRVLEHMNKMTDYTLVNDLVDELFFNGILCSVMAEITATPLSNQALQTAGLDYYQQGKSFMERHYDKEITVSDVADYVQLERSYFSKLFKARQGQSPYQYIMSLRLNKARSLLHETALPIEHIALLLGFKDTYHFSHFFKNKEGCSPLRYRNRKQHPSIPS